MIKAVAYARYSSDNQRDESIDAQLRAIDEYAKKEGYVIVDKYIDQALSATTDQRPEFLRMIDEAESSDFKAVIVHKLDRFSRDRYDSIKYKRRLQLAGVCLISVTERLDDTPESIMLEAVIQGMNEYYSKNLAREVKKGLMENAYNCKYNGGIVPLGYSIDENNNFVINDYEAMAVKLIFYMYANGRGYSEILDELNHRGYKTKRGKPFGKNSLFSILRNEKYIGVYEYNRLKTSEFGRRVKKERDEKEIVRIEGGVPAIIKLDVWERCKMIREYNKKNPSSFKKKANVYLLTGKAYCGRCGAKMIGKMRKNDYKTYYYYECSARNRFGTCPKSAIRQDKLEEIVLERVYADILSPEKIEATADFIYLKLQQVMKDIPTEEELLKAQLATVKNQINNYLDLIEAGTFNQSMMERFNKVESQKIYLEKLLEELDEKKRSHSYTKDEICEFLLQYTTIRDVKKSAQKKALQTILNKVIVYDEKIEIQVLTQKKEDTENVSPLMVRMNRVKQQGHKVILYLVLSNIDLPLNN